VSAVAVIAHELLPLSTAATVPPKGDVDGILATVTVKAESAVKVAVQVVFADNAIVVEAVVADTGV
jgi:hypothetical protein